MEKEIEIETKSDTLKAATTALVRGKRHLCIKEIPQAVTALSEACRLFSEAVGIFSIDSADAHYYYGKSLLEHARFDLNVFENQPTGANTTKSGEEDSDDEDEEMEEDDDDEEDADGEASVKTKDEKEEKITVDTNKTENVLLVDDDDERPSTSLGTGGEADPDVTVPEEDEPTNLELAWEVLEVSKVSYTRLVEEATQKVSEVNENESGKTAEQEELKNILKDYRNKMALVHSTLGEVATESEQYSQAVEEINTALAILREIEEYDNREIAQCYFQLGIAYSFDKKYDDAISSFKKAVELIEKRIENLEKKSAAVKATDENGLDKNADIAEIEELKALLPELQEKITDTLDAEKDAVRVNEEEKQEQELILRASPVKNPNPPVVNDISHLVKKKKKAEDLLDEEPPSKKICTEPDSTSKCSNGENGDHEAVNGSTITAE